MQPFGDERRDGRRVRRPDFATAPRRAAMAIADDESRCRPTAGRQRRRTGQALVEFALVLPFLMLLLLTAANFGQAFNAWVNLNQAVRVAANFAAENPAAWGSPGDPQAIAEYEREVQAEAAHINCTGLTINAPTFPAGTDPGSPATVTLNCNFGLFFPIITDVLGSQVHLTASATFPIRAGMINGVPVQLVPPTPSPTPEATPTTSPTPTPLPTITAPPTCKVPNVIGERPNTASTTWSGAGFLTPLIFNPQVPPNNWTIHTQSKTAGVQLPCGSTVMTVTP